MLRYLTAGESHGECLSAILEGMPAGVSIDCALINKEMARRQAGYGRGGRMKIEKDLVKITSGVRDGKTLGSPISLLLTNLDYPAWQEVMAVGPLPEPVVPLTQPRPGHADLSGAIKYAHHDIRNVLERSSARETAMRVAVGAIAKQLLAEFDISVRSIVTAVGGVRMPALDLPYPELFAMAEKSPLRCPDEATTRKMISCVDDAKKAGDSVGGIFEVIALNVPLGLGSHVHWDRKLDGRLARALMSIQAIKGVEIGTGFALADLLGSCAHDEIFYDSGKGFYHRSNRCGGIEGGTTNGEDIVARAVMKPIPTLMQPLRSVDVISKEQVLACKERSDTCAVPAAAVIGEAVVAIEIVCAMQEKFAGDSLFEMRGNYHNYVEMIKKY